MPVNAPETANNIINLILFEHQHYIVPLFMFQVMEELGLEEADLHEPEEGEDQHGSTLSSSTHTSTTTHTSATTHTPALPPTPALPALAPPPALLQLAPHLLLAPPSALLQLAPAPTHVTGETCHFPKPHIDVIVTFHDFV